MISKRNQEAPTSQVFEIKIKIMIELIMIRIINASMADFLTRDSIIVTARLEIFCVLLSSVNLHLTRRRRLWHRQRSLLPH